MEKPILHDAFAEHFPLDACAANASLAAVTDPSGRAVRGMHVSAY